MNNRNSRLMFEQLLQAWVEKIVNHEIAGTEVIVAAGRCNADAAHTRGERGLHAGRGVFKNKAVLGPKGYGRDLTQPVECQEINRRVGFRRRDFGCVRFDFKEFSQAGEIKNESDFLRQRTGGKGK